MQDRNQVAPYGATEKEIEEEILETWLEAASNVIIWRFINGVSAMLELDRGELIKYMPKFLPPSLLQDTRRREDVALTDAITRIAETLADHDAWDAYSASRVPSTYRYAAAVASWLYLLATSYGGVIPLDCPLFDRRVVAAVTEFLATKVAYPIYDSLHEALIDVTSKWIRSLPPERREEMLKMPRERRVEEALIRFCSPP